MQILEMGVNQPPNLHSTILTKSPCPDNRPALQSPYNVLVEDPGGDPAMRDLLRVLVSNDVSPQSYAHAYLLILLHLNTELTKHEPKSVKSYEIIASLKYHKIMIKYTTPPGPRMMMRIRLPVSGSSLPSTWCPSPLRSSASPPQRLPWSTCTWTRGRGCGGEGGQQVRGVGGQVG